MSEGAKTTAGLLIRNMQRLSQAAFRVEQLMPEVPPGAVALASSISELRAANIALHQAMAMAAIEGARLAAATPAATPADHFAA